MPTSFPTGAKICHSLAQKLGSSSERGAKENCGTEAAQNTTISGKTSEYPLGWDLLACFYYLEFVNCM